MNKNIKPHRRHKVTSPYLRQILDLFTVREIMTPSEKFFCCQSNQNVSDAKALMEKYRFSAAPLEEKVKALCESGRPAETRRVQYMLF